MDFNQSLIKLGLSAAIAAVIYGLLISVIQRWIPVPQLWWIHLAGWIAVFVIVLLFVF